MNRPLPRSVFRFADACEIVAPRILPWASVSPPWSFCGDRNSPDFGTVFARPDTRFAEGAFRPIWRLTFDRRGRYHAMDIFDMATLRDEVVIYDRRFHVVRLYGPEAAAGAVCPHPTRKPSSHAL